MARATNPAYGGIQIPTTAWSVVYDCIGTDASVEPDAHMQAWTKVAVGTPVLSAQNGLFAAATTGQADSVLYSYNVAAFETYTGAYIEALVKVASAPTGLDNGCILALELGDAAAALYLRDDGLNLMGASNVAQDLTGWNWVRLGLYGAEARAWVNGQQVQSAGFSYLTTNRRARWGIPAGDGPASATFRYVQARPMWGAERLWSDALVTIGPFTETLTDFASAEDGSSYRFIQVDHSEDANFALAEEPVFAMAGQTYLSDAGILVEMLGQSTGSTFEAKVTNLSYETDLGYGAAGPDVVLTWTRRGLLEP